MKTLICLFATAMLLFAGCAKDRIFTDNAVNPELKNASVPIPTKGEVCMIPNEQDQMPVTAGPNGPVIPNLTMVRTAHLTGQEAHMGNIGEQSLMTGISAYLDMAELSKGRRVLVSVYEVKTYGANGDYSLAISSSRIDATDKENMIITGDFTITGGSGKWENTTGGGVISGVLPCWKLEGTIQFEK